MANSTWYKGWDIETHATAFDNVYIKEVKLPEAFMPTRMVFAYEQGDQTHRLLEIVETALSDLDFKDREIQRLNDALQARMGKNA